MSLSRRSMRWFAAILLCGVALGVSGCRKKTPAEKFQEAQQLIAERQNALAVIKFEALIKDSPEAPEATQARLMLGEYYLQAMNQPDRAMEYYKDVHQREGLTQVGSAALSRMISIYMGTGKAADAIALVENSMKAQGTDPALLAELQVLRGDLKLASGDDTLRDEALAEWKTLMLEHEDPQLRGMTREKLANYFRMNQQFDASNTVYEEYIAKYNDDETTPQLRIAQALNLRSTGKGEEATKLFDENAAVVRKQIEEELVKDRRARLLLDLGRYYEAMGRLEEAEALMKRVMGENPMSRIAIDTQFAIANMYRNAGNFDRSIELFEQISRENAGTNIAQMSDAEIQKTKAYLDMLKNQQAAETTATVPMQQDPAQVPAGS